MLFQNHQLLNFPSLAVPPPSPENTLEQMLRNQNNQLEKLFSQVGALLELLSKLVIKLL